MSDSTHISSSDFQRQRPWRSRAWDTSGVEHIALRTLMALSAICIGVIGVVFGRIIRVHYLEPMGLQLEPGGHNLRPLFDFCFSYMFCKLFGATFGQSFPLAARFRLVGVWGSLLLMHNVVWWYPEWVATLYTAEFVEDVQERSNPDSVFAVTSYISFSDLFANDKEPEEVVAPRETPEFFMRADEGIRLEGFRTTGEEPKQTKRFVISR